MAQAARVRLRRRGPRGRPAAEHPGGRAGRHAPLIPRPPRGAAPAAAARRRSRSPGSPPSTPAGRRAGRPLRLTRQRSRGAPWDAS
ncbi:hypothetical protein DDW44_18640 [Streptomyces tirandamycinicus]|uniref:Uncharacterized protein n=1 Tax=Streptomyces tirandamycinicus TaxID=2174846 RepID=A0A2S1SVX6_9ACTN|nr:hypothetical protein DDW44_18640 [Streptomyces tirandamycinicus]